MTLLWALLLTPCFPLDADQRASLDTTLEKIRGRAGVPGLAVGIIERGQVLYVGTFGVRDLASGAPVNDQTLFHLASISKTFTAAAIVRLAENGKLAIADPIEKYLPQFAGDGITLEHLLTHSAGLQDWLHPAAGATQDSRVSEYVLRLARHKPSYPAGKGWSYSDADFNVLGAVIEKSSGKPYVEYVASELLAPLGLTNCTAQMPKSAENFAWPHVGEKIARRAKNHPYDLAFVPSSGIECNITDLLRWGWANLARDSRMLSEATFVSLFQKRVDTKWPGVSMSLAWQLDRGSDGATRIFHPGGDPGFRTLLVLYPKDQRVIAILANGEATPRFEIRDAIEKFLGP